MTNLEQLKRAKEIIDEYKMEVLKYVKEYFEASRRVTISNELTNLQVYSFDDISIELDYNGDIIDVNIYHSDANGDWVYNLYVDSLAKYIEPPTENTLSIQGEIVFVFPNIVGCDRPMEKTVYMRKYLY